MSENDTDDGGLYRCIACGYGPSEDAEEVKNHIGEEHDRFRFPADAVEQTKKDGEEKTEQKTLVTDGGVPRQPNRYQQVKEAARDDPSRTELTNMLYDLSHVHEVMVDWEDEDRRPTVITVGFDDEGYRDTGHVIEVMQIAGWSVHHVVFAPMNRITFQEVSADA